MSFLDNLEDNLKALESREATGLDDSKRRDTERKQAAAVAPWADRLKRDPFTQSLLQVATRAGYQLRTKVNFMWLGTTLRLEAREQRLELRPSAAGITAVYLKGGHEVRSVPVDLAAQPDTILRDWIAMIEAQKKLDAERAATLPEDE